jgi:hypothetical protein
MTEFDDLVRSLLVERFGRPPRRVAGEAKQARSDSADEQRIQGARGSTNRKASRHSGRMA